MRVVIAGPGCRPRRQSGIGVKGPFGIKLSPG